MLNREEEKLLKRYSVLNTIGIEARFLVGIIVAVGWLLDWIGVLCFLNRAVTVIMGTMIFWGLLGIYCVIMLCGVYIPYHGMRRQMWSALVEKALEEYKRKHFSDEMSEEIDLATLEDMKLAVGKNKGYAVIHEAGPFVEKLDRWDFHSHAPIYPVLRAAEVKHDINFVAETCGVKLPETIGLIFLTAAVPMLILVAMFVNNYII